jgi:hypothetical protein
MVCEPDRSPRSWRRFLRVGVRGLIVVVLVIGAGLGWIVRQAQIQRDAVAAIKNTGGSVSYNWEFNNGKPLPGGKPWAPGWLVNLVGVDYFGHVTGAVAHHMSAATSVDVIAQVGRLTRVQGLILNAISPSSCSAAHGSPTPGWCNLHGDRVQPRSERSIHERVDGCLDGIP